LGRNYNCLHFSALQPRLLTDNTDRPSGADTMAELKRESMQVNATLFNCSTTIVNPFALSTIRNGDGCTLPDHFDPDVLAAFLNINKQFDDVYSGSLNA
jgi:hypothetical protein